MMSFNDHPVLAEQSILGFEVLAVHVLYITSWPALVVTHACQIYSTGSSQTQPVMTFR